jgi:hypothetical protein
MKKSFLKLASIFIILISNPVLAQLTDPGDDPDAPVAEAPINNYVLVLAAIGLIYVFLKIRSFALHGKIPK